MNLILLKVIILCGQCVLSAWSNHAYRLVETKLPWAAAQSYCRENYLDLATVDSEEEFDQLMNATKRSPPLGPVWTGLYSDVKAWTWSLQNGYYGPGEDQLRLWASGEPVADVGYSCGIMPTDARWKSSRCESIRPFFCYNASATPGFVFVNILLNWSDAQSYCRQHHTDMVSVRNLTENRKLNALMLPMNMFTWLGLYRDHYQKWFDGSPVLFTKFNNTGLRCVVVDGSDMVGVNCSLPYPFVCNDYPLRQVVKSKFQSNPSLNLEGLSEDMLEQLIIQLQMEFKKYGMDGTVKLTWRKQPDGNVFSRKKENQQNAVDCPYHN